MRRLLFLPYLAAIPLISALLAQEAHACGGTFCSGPGTPVDQTGENVLFIVDGPAVEAHIQIQYDPNTEADQFSWVIPVPQLPEFAVGSDPLFTSLLNASVPRYSLATTDSCAPPPPNGGGGSFIQNPDGGGVNVEEVHKETVGAFDITVLQSNDAQELLTWLDDNGYAQDPDAEPIIAQYLAEGSLFVALRLNHNAGLDQIHPIVLRYENSEPCVPLRLTRIAAQEDMDVRTFFLSDVRMAPTNFKHVLVNPLKIDWLNLAANYKQVITMAVDEGPGGGKAFVTEFAGSSANVSTFGVYDESWNDTSFVGMHPNDVMDELAEQSLAWCFDGICQFNHPLILPLLRQYIPAPADVDEEDFYSCVSCYEDSLDLQAWSDVDFAADLRERIIDPGFHAVELLDTWPYLTRLYTTISPGEMTVDPIFHPHPSLPDVSNIRQATQQIDCSDNRLVTLPDGREVFIPAGQDWPSFQDEMPWVEDVEELAPGAGAPVNMLDNTATIDALLAEWNTMNGWPGGGGTGGTTGADGTADGGQPGGDEDGGLDGGGTTGDASSGGGLESPDGSCNCRSGNDLGSGLLFGLGLLGAGLRRRRRA